MPYIVARLAAAAYSFILFVHDPKMGSGLADGAAAEASGGCEWKGSIT